MKALYLVCHEIRWGGENIWDRITANVVAKDASEAIKKHEKVVSKLSYQDEDNGKKVSVKQVKLIEVKQINSIDIG